MRRLITPFCLLLAIAVHASAQNTAAIDSIAIKNYGKHYHKPMFTGGPDSLKAFIRKNLLYPVAAIENNIEGRVIVRFIVEEDGTISHIDLTRGIVGICDDEIMRLVRSMPVWEPATYRNRPIRAVETLPVVFKLE